MAESERARLLFVGTAFFVQQRVPPVARWRGRDLLELLDSIVRSDEYSYSQTEMKGFCVQR